jgi:hypothetical protein
MPLPHIIQECPAADSQAQYTAKPILLLVLAELNSYSYPKYLALVEASQCSRFGFSVLSFPRKQLVLVRLLYEGSTEMWMYFRDVRTVN